MSDNKALFLYDFLLVKGGAEAVTLDLCRRLTQLDLGVAFVDRQLFPEIPQLHDRMFTLTQFTPIVGWQILKAALFFQYRGKRLGQYDRIIYSGICSLLGFSHAKQSADNILYCHTPPRFIYDLKNYYLASASWPKRQLIRLLGAYLKPRYQRSIAAMDLVIANSHNVRQRLKTYLNIESIVIYPPCHTEQFNWISQQDYYLSTARVENYKRLEVIVAAFIAMPEKRLIVTSGGSELRRLQEMAKDADNIRFTGWCDLPQLTQLLGQCIASIYLPINEDFGISPVESMAAGKPVIGVREGGVVETVIDGKTGILCPPNPQIEDVIKAVKQMTPEKALSMRFECESSSKRFSVDTFISKMFQLIECDKSQMSRLSIQLHEPMPN